MNLRKILVVEDSPLLHQMYDVTLLRYRSNGTTILHAHNGLAALRLLRDNPDTDLILLDLNMPIMGGIEFLRVRQGHTQFKAIPVIVVTIQGQETSTAEAMEAGASVVLPKPMRTDVLHAEMEKLFGSHSLQA